MNHCVQCGPRKERGVVEGACKCLSAVVVGVVCASSQCPKLILGR